MMHEDEEQFFFAPHTHTKFSDGLKSPSDALQAAIKLGFSAYAITDHETVDAFFDPELESFMKLTGEDALELIPGVELTTIGGVPHSKELDIEMIGLCIDPHARPIHDVCNQNQEVRRDWKRKTFKIVNDFFDFRDKDVINDYFLERTNSGKIGTVVKPHFINALLSHPKVLTWLKTRKNLEGLINEKIENFVELKKEVDTALKEDVRKSVYTEYLFSMFRSPDETPYGKTADENYGVFFVPKEFIDMADGISAIRESGGVVIIPHAFVSAKRVGLNVKEFLRLFEGYFKEDIISGIETEYPILPKYQKYYEKYGKGRRITRPITPGRPRDSDRYPTIEKDLTIREMQAYANSDMEDRVIELEGSLGIDPGAIIRLKVSDCHFDEGDHLLRFCSGKDEYDQLMEAKRKST